MEGRVPGWDLPDDHLSDYSDVSECATAPLDLQVYEADAHTHEADHEGVNKSSSSRPITQLPPEDIARLDLVILKIRKVFDRPNSHKASVQARRERDVQNILFSGDIQTFEEMEYVNAECFPEEDREDSFSAPPPEPSTGGPTSSASSIWTSFRYIFFSS